ncbi:MAG: (Fe-S)-binding protein [Desulfarculaceae bacterium]
MAGRPAFFGAGPSWVFYALAAVSVAILALGIWGRLGVWLKSFSRQPGFSLKSLLVQGLWQPRLWRRDPVAALIHLALLWGFLILFMGTLLLAIHDRLIPFLQGVPYLVYSLVLDLAGLAYLAGVAGLALRRLLLGRRRLPGGLGDWAVLGLLFLVGFSGYLAEAARLAATRPDWAWAEPVGSWLAQALSWGGPSDRALLVIWWLHALSALALIAALPWIKLWHALAAPFNLGLAGAGRGIAAAEEREEAAGEFSFANLVAADACTRCNRCELVCPSHLAGEGLSPRSFTQGLKRYAWLKYRPLNQWRFLAAQARDELLHRPTISSDHAFMCTTCGACQEVCPVEASPLRLIRQVRTTVLEQGTAVPPALNKALTHLGKYANPWGSPRSKRAAWLKDLPLADFSKGDEAAWLLFAGCTTSLDSRAQKMARAMARILEHGGVRAGALGREEPCCGDLARRLGEAGLYEMLVEDNLELLNDLEVEQVVTMSPHCAYTMTQDYPRLAPELGLGPSAAMGALHYSQVLERLLDQGRLQVAQRLDYRVTFHDPCYLGRHRGLYAPPRRVLGGLGLELVEMRDHAGDSLCCGAGGGRMWHAEIDGADTQISALRVAQARETGARLLVTACPLCLIMLSDGVKTAGLEGDLEVIDLAELTARALGLDQD